MTLGSSDRDINCIWWHYSFRFQQQDFTRWSYELNRCTDSHKKTKTNQKKGTDRSGHGRWEGAIVHVGRVVHVAHHDVTWVARVWVAFTVQVLEFSWCKSRKEVMICCKFLFSDSKILQTAFNTNQTNKQQSSLTPVSKSGLFYWAGRAACLFPCCNDITVEHFNPCPVLPQPFVYVPFLPFLERRVVLCRGIMEPLCAN